MDSYLIFVSLIYFLKIRNCSVNFPFLTSVKLTVAPGYQISICFSRFFARISDISPAESCYSSITIIGKMSN